jgi:hypothetical protein
MKEDKEQTSEEFADKLLEENYFDSKAWANYLMPSQNEIGISKMNPIVQKDISEYIQKTYIKNDKGFIRIPNYNKIPCDDKQATIDFAIENINRSQLCLFVNLKQKVVQ